MCVCVCVCVCVCEGVGGWGGVGGWEGGQVEYQVTLMQLSGSALDC